MISMRSFVEKMYTEQMVARSDMKDSFLCSRTRTNHDEVEEGAEEAVFPNDVSLVFVPGTSFRLLHPCEMYQASLQCGVKVHAGATLYGATVFRHLDAVHSAKRQRRWEREGKRKVLLSTFIFTFIMV